MDLPDGTHVTGTYDWPSDTWTVEAEGLASGAAQSRTTYGALRELCGIRASERSPGWLIDAAQQLPIHETPLGPRVQCRCCGQFTLTRYGHYDHCGVCGWEDDPTTILFANESPGGPGPNHISLSEARQNYRTPEERPS